MPSYDYTDPQGKSFTLDVDEELAPQQVYQRFVDAGIAPKTQSQRETPGYLSQLGSALGLGYRQMKSGLGATFNAATGDVQDTASAMAEMGALQREQEANLTPEDVALNEAFARNEAEYNASQGLFDATKALSGYVGSTLAHPGAAFKQVVQSAPNALVGGATELGGYALGGLIGTGAGIEAGPGAIATGIAGAMAGGAVSNTLLEAGPAIFDILNERTNGAASSMTADQIAQVLQKNPDIMSEGLKTGAIRGSVIGAIEGLGMKGAGSLLTIPERAAARAMQKTLVDAGVDVASKKAVEKALLDPTLRTAAATAAETAKKQFTSAGNLARFAGGAAIETGSAGAGELGAQVATGQQVSPTGVFQEMLGEAGMSLPLAGTTKAWEARKYLVPQVAQNQLESSVEGVINNADVAPLTAQVLANESPDATPAGGPVPGATETEEIPGIGAINRADLAGVSEAAPPVANEPPPSENLVGDAGEVIPTTEESSLVAPEDEAVVTSMVTPQPQTTQTNALQKQSTGSVLQREQKEARKTGSERERVEPSLEGQEAAGARQGEEKVRFKTAKGSEYVLLSDGTTIRNKAERPEHPGEKGIMPRSSRTIFVTKDGMEALGIVQTEGVKFNIEQRPDGTWGAKAIDGPHAGKFYSTSLTQASDTPEIGMIPVEIWNRPGKPQAVHFGNSITEITPQGKPTTATEGKVMPGGSAVERDLTKPEQMTLAEFRRNPVGLKYQGRTPRYFPVGGSEASRVNRAIDNAHFLKVEKALKSGTKVPMEVMRDYTGLLEKFDNLYSSQELLSLYSDLSRSADEKVATMQQQWDSGEPPFIWAALQEAKKKASILRGKFTEYAARAAREKDFQKTASKLPETGDKPLEQIPPASLLKGLFGGSLQAGEQIAESFVKALGKWDSLTPNQQAPFMKDKYPDYAYAGRQTGVTGNGQLFATLRLGPQRVAINNAIESKKPVSAAAVDTYGIKLPQGYIKQGDLYVFQPEIAASPTAPKAPNITAVEVIPEDYARAQANAEKGGEKWGDVETNKQPIKAYRKPDGQLKMYDGHHRLVNAQQKGKKTIPVSIDGEGVVDVPLSAFQTEQYGRPDLKKEVSQTTAAEKKPSGIAPPAIIPKAEGGFSKELLATEERKQAVIGYAKALLDQFPSLSDVEIISPNSQDELIRTVENIHGKRDEDVRNGIYEGEWLPEKRIIIIPADARLSTIAHEVGHAVLDEYWENADEATKKAIQAEHAAWAKKSYGKPTVADSLRSWQLWDQERFPDLGAIRKKPKGVSAAAMKSTEDYRTSFLEWTADQFSYWSQTKKQPKSLVDKFFADLSAQLAKIWDAVKQHFAPNATYANWIESLLKPQTAESPTSEKAKAGNAALDAILAQIPELERSKWTPAIRAKASKFFESGNSADLEGLTRSQKININEARYRSNPQAAAEERIERQLQERRLREQKQEDAQLEKERERQAKLTESRRNSLDSIIGKPQEVEMDAVSVGDGRESLAMVHNSGDVPGVLNAFVGTSKDFLANPENEKNFSGLYRLLKAGRVDEGNFAYGRAFVFTDGIGINAVDRANAVKLGVTPAVAAVRRVLIHESLVHRGIFGLPAHLQRRILQWVQQNTTPEQLDVLAKTYPRYADWRSNENQLLALCEEFLAKKVEKLTTIPKTGPLARLMDILSDIWRWITGNTGEPTIKNLKDVVKLLKAGAEAADARLVNGGKIKMSQLRAQGFVTPEMDKAYMDAVNAGDMEKAQRMVDAAAKAAGYNVGPVAHGGPDSDFTEFKAGEFGFHFGDITAAEMMGQARSFYLRMKNPLRSKDIGVWKPDALIQRLGAMGSNGGIPWSRAMELQKESSALQKKLKKKIENDNNFVEARIAHYQASKPAHVALKEAGYDGVVYKNEAEGFADSFIALDPSQIKSADPVTRDDAGNVIPLSQRFNAASPDIRASYIGEGAIKNFPEERRQFMRDSLDAAKAMAAAGKSSEEIRAVTGWFPGKYDGKMRWEIPDNEATFKALPKATQGQEIHISYFLHHPKLFEAYPDLKKILLEYDPDLTIQGQFKHTADWRHAKIVVGPRTKDQLSTILHEIQHWIQYKESFANGADFNLLLKDAALDRIGAINKYKIHAGEIEARDVQARQKLTSEQRKAVAPYSSENIAPEDAIVIFGNQGVQESRPTYANPIDAQLANAAERMRAMREREAAPPVPKTLARLFDTNAQPTGTANKLFQTAQAPESGKLGDIEAMSPENIDWSLTQLDGRMRQDALGASYEHYKNANVADQWYRYLANKVLSEDALMELNSMYAEMNPNAQFIESDLPRAAFKTGDISELTPEQTSWILLNADGEDRQRLLGVTRKHYSDSATADQWANYLAGKIANDPEAMAELSAMHQEMNPNAREEEVTPLDNIKRIVSESVSRSEVESLLKDLNTEEIKEIVRSIGYPTQGTKADNIRRILSFVGSRADAIAIRGINPINLNAPTIVRTPEQQAAFDEELRLAKERANELDISLPQKKPLYDQEKWNRNMAAIMAPSSVAPQKIRNEIRAAYDRASAKISDIWVPFQAVYDEVKKSFPSLTEREFGEQVQLLYEMDSAVVQNFLPSTADVLASGDKWGVYYNTGLGSASPASSMLVMPDIKASRQEKENVDTAIHSTRGMKGKVDNIIKELPANSYTGKPLKDAVSQSFAPISSRQFYDDMKPMVIKSIDEMVKRGVDEGDLLQAVLDPTFVEKTFDGWNPSAKVVVQQLFFAEALKRAVNKQDQFLKEKDVTGYNLQQQKIDAWSKDYYSKANEFAAIGNAIQHVMDDPDYQGQLLLTNFSSQKVKQEKEVTDSSMKDPVKAAEEIDKAGKDSKDDADGAVSDAAEELSLEDLIRDGEASLSDAEKSLWQRAKEYMIHLGAIAKAEIQAAFTGKASNAISASDLVKHYIAMPKDKRDKEKARFKKELNDVLGKLIGDKTTAKGKKKGDLVEAFEKKRSRESIKDKVFGPDEQKAFKALIRKLNAARPGETTPLARVSSWKALFEMTPTDQGMMKGRMFDTIKNDPAFDNLTPEEQQKLATLLEKAWDKRREQFLTRELDRIIRTQNMSKKAAKALEQRPAILRKIDSGVFDYENLAALVGEQYGIKNLTPQEAKRVKEISSELGQDLMPHERTKLQDELQELMVSKNLSLGEMLKAWWITAVLTGPRTAFTIGLSFMTGGFELVGHSMSVLANPKMSMQEKSAAISDAIKNWWGSIGREAKAAWMFVLTGDKTIQDPSALMSPQFFDKQFRGNMGRFSFSAAEKMIKSTNPVIRYMGWFMTYAGRILNALDTFNYGITKAGSAPLVYSMLHNAYKPGQMSTSKLVREAKNEIIQKGFNGEAPNASTLNAWARNLAYAKLETITGMAENMNQVAKQGNFTLEPTGFGGLIYNALKHTDAFVQRWAEERVNRMRKDMLKGDNYWIEQRLFNVAEFVQAGLMQVLPILGLQFAKFATNSLNQTISFIPIAGLGRLKEQVDGQAVHNKMIWRNQAIGSAAFMWIYITLKAIEQEPDDEKRGWGIEGDWSNLTPQEKRQRDATGLKENTIWWRNKDGKRVVLNYVNWPVRPLLAAFGSMSDQIKYAPDQWQKGGVMKRGVTTGWAMAKSVLNTSAVSQFTELFGSNIASRDPVEAFTNKAARVFGGYAGGFVPRIIKDIDRWMQPEINKYEGWEYLGKELPFYRRSIGHEYLDVFGKVIAPSQAAWSREMVQQPMEPEYRMLGRLNSRGLWLTPAVAENRLVGKGSHKRPMTDEEAQRYVKAVGQGYREMILRYGDRLLSMPKDRAKDFLAAKSDDVRDRSVKLATRPQ